MAELIGISLESALVRYIWREIQPLLAEKPDVLQEFIDFAETSDVMTTRPLPGTETLPGIIVMQVCFTAGAEKILRKAGDLAEMLLDKNCFGGES